MSNRKALYAKTAIAIQQLAIADDDFRDIMAERYGGRTSRTALSDAELADLMEHFKRLGFRDVRIKLGSRGAPKAGRRATNAKIRALWISCHELGAVSNRSERALGAFVKRQTGLDKLAWLAPDQAHVVIDALKAMAQRAGVDWREHESPRVCVARAQWRRLAAIGAVRIASPDGLDAWLQSARITPHKSSMALIDDARRDEAIVRLGDWLRRELARLPHGSGQRPARGQAPGATS